MEQLKINTDSDTIAAVSTPYGTGGIAVIRISGPDSISIVDSAWRGKPLSLAKSHTVHLGNYYSTDSQLLDEAVATLFRSPASFTGEDVVELSIHGSRWIQREIISDLVRRGARVAEPGEFTKRAFLNGKIDLAKAEGVADLIASSSKAAHTVAISQTRGEFSRNFELIREKLIEFASLLELELDFSEEDVEFADRQNLLRLALDITAKLKRLADSYSTGSVIKDGVPVVIAGIPNAGKSSVLNLLLNDDKAIVSEIPGTTRDSIEDTIEINGILYRFIDTAGIRNTDDTIESLGIDRAKKKMSQAKIVIWVIDPIADLTLQTNELKKFKEESPATKIILLVNKSDLLKEQNDSVTLPPHYRDTLKNSTKQIPNEGNPDIGISNKDTHNKEVADKSISNEEARNVEASDEKNSNGDTHHVEAFHGEEVPKKEFSNESVLIKEILREYTEHITADIISFSAHTGEGFGTLLQSLQRHTLSGFNPGTETIVTNARHYEAILHGITALNRASEAISAGISADFIAQDVREAIHHLSTITGSITTPTLLSSIFSRFCIGK